MALEHTMKDNASIIESGGVEVEFNGERRVLFFNYRALRALEKYLRDENIVSTIGELLTQKYLHMSPEVTAAVFWAGMLHYKDFDMSPDDVGEVIVEQGKKGVGGFSGLGLVCGLALSRAGKGVEEIQELAKATAPLLEKVLAKKRKK